jgi:sortase (surface protein transpeptidase)
VLFGRNRSPERQGRRRMTAAALTLSGLCFASAGVVKLAEPSGTGQLDRSDQMKRVLPPPTPGPLRGVALLGATPPTQPKPAAKPAAKAPRPRPVPREKRVWKQMPPPSRLEIPAIGVSAPIIKLGRNGDGTAQVPHSFSDAGWFEPGPEPGERGAAVLLGHVDSVSGPGVFYRLRALRRNDRIRVVLRNGKRLQFVVTGTMEAPKNRFPTKLVYKRTPGATLRLITCGGAFNRSTGHYVDNYIVFAWLVGRP